MFSAFSFGLHVEGETSFTYFWVLPTDIYIMYYLPILLPPQQGEEEFSFDINYQNSILTLARGLT